MNDRSDERWATQAQPRPDYRQILIQKSLDIVSVIDREGIIRFVNPAVERVLGYPPEDLTGISLFDLLHPRDVEKVKTGLARLANGLQSGRTAQYRVRHRDGSWRTLEAIGRNLADDPAASEIIVDTRDITGRKRALKALRQSRKFARRIAESVPDALVVYDLIHDRLVYASREVVGYRPEQIRAMGRDRFATLLHPDDRAVIDGRLRKMERAREGEVLEAEYRLMDRDGCWRWISSRDAIFSRTPEGAPQQIIGALRDITARKQADSDLEAHEAELRRSREELRALAARLLTVAEEERKALSRELHDDLNQRLAILAIDLETIASGLSPGHPLRRELELLESRLIELTEDVRRMAYQLRPSILDDLGLVPALRSYCEQFGSRERVAVIFTHAGLPGTLKPELALCLYRIAQEALRNIAKHAHTRHAAVALSADDGAVVLNVRDWGAGFDPGAAHRNGLGIVGMGERVRLAGGSFEVRSQPGHGTEIEVSIPFTVEAE